MATINRGARSRPASVQPATSPTEGPGRFDDVAEFVEGMQAESARVRKINRDAILTAGAVYVGARVWSAYRHSGSRGRR